MDCVVATRMHAAIYALSSGVPALLIGYQPKAAGLMQLLGLAEWVLPIEEVQTDCLYRRVTALLADLASVRVQVAHAMEAAQQRLAGWTQLLEG
jgi:colanic acid/amylovoran biosynthesis protein